MIIGRQIAAAMALLRLSAAALAEKAGISVSTVKRAQLAADVPHISAPNLARIERFE
jgi:transcriptional regulator with XRE-family HTH domain